MIIEYPEIRVTIEPIDIKEEKSNSFLCKRFNNVSVVKLDTN